MGMQENTASPPLALPLLLTAVIEEARRALLANVKWSLSPYYRYCIYCALEPELSSPATQRDGSPRLVKLATLANRKVFAIRKYSACRSTNSATPLLVDVSEDLIEAAEAWLADPSDEVGTVFEDGWVLVDNTVIEDSGDSEYLLQFWMLSAALLIWKSTFAFCNVVGESPDKNKLTDADFDPFTTDSAFYAAEAYCGDSISYSGAPFDRDKSLEFWSWWLDEAVPAAWHSAALPSDIPASNP